MNNPPEVHAAALIEFISQWRSCAVAFSGGVDSAVVAAAAQRALGSRAVAVTADSPSLPRRELGVAAEVASDIGIEHLVIHTGEGRDPRYVRNDAQRCFWCKHELYQKILRLRATRGFDVILNGTNVDDLSEYRPGLRAAAEHDVASPLVACSLSKSDVRRLAQYWRLSVADKPAGPCLASRIALGLQVTPSRLSRVEQAETILQNLGFCNMRVRLHTDQMVRIEVEADRLPDLVAPQCRQRVLARFAELGFRYITLDLQGFRSGSFSAPVQLQ